MERLVKRVGTGNAVPTKFDMDFVFELDIDTFHGIQKIFNQLCNLTDILGDNYDLDRLRELVEADKEGRCVALPFAPGDEVWVVERDETGEPDCVSGYVFVSAASGVALVHPFIGGSGDLYDILQDCLDNTAEADGTCDIAAYPLDDCYGSRKDAEAALEGE